MISQRLRYLAARFARQAQGLDRDLPPPLPGHLADALLDMAEQVARLEHAAWRALARAATPPIGGNVVALRRPTGGAA